MATYTDLNSFMIDRGYTNKTLGETLGFSSPMTVVYIKAGLAQPSERFLEAFKRNFPGYHVESWKTIEETTPTSPEPTKTEEKTREQPQDDDNLGKGEKEAKKAVFILMGELQEDTFVFESGADALLFLAKRVLEYGNWALRLDELLEDTFAFKSETDALLFLAERVLEDGNWVLARKVIL